MNANVRVQQLEARIGRRDNTIARLKDQLKSRDAAVERLKEEVEDALRPPYLEVLEDAELDELISRLNNKQERYIVP